jgi:hypothetical protein
MKVKATIAVIMDVPTDSITVAQLGVAEMWDDRGINMVTDPLSYEIHGMDLVNVEYYIGDKDDLQLRAEQVAKEVLDHD